MSGTPKPYLSLEELTECLPFSAQAIRMYMHRGELVEGRHYYRKGRRLIFKWAAIVKWIEGEERREPADIVPLYRAGGSG